MVGQHSHRRGFTIIEALVVAAVVALICAVAVPLIQSHRESARRNQCSDRLKQLGLALHNYQDTHMVFPPGFVVGANDVYHGWSWSVFIVPYLDDNPWYNGIQFESGLQTEYLKPELHPHWSSFRCPTDSGADVVSSVSMVTTKVVDWTVTPGSTQVKNTFARSNYFGSAGFLHEYAGGLKTEEMWKIFYTDADANLNPRSLGTAATKYSRYHRYVDQMNFGGVFGQNSKVRVQDMADGTSNTFMVGERYTPRASLNEAPVIGDGGWLGVPDPTTAAGLAMSLGDTSVGLNHNIHRRQTTGFGSNHVGGANLLFADGRVRLVNEKIGLVTYRGLSGINDFIPKSCGY